MSVIYAQIYKIVQSIPKGKVLTYGLISHLIGGRMSAQGVGWAMKALGGPEKAKALQKSDKKTFAVKYNSSTVPWQRVVNSQGGTSTHKIADIPPGFQQALLEKEGIDFDHEGKMDLEQHLWTEGLKKFAKVSAKLEPPKRKK